MRQELQITGLIERYLRNELSKEELAAFEIKLQSSETLQNDVKLQNELLEGIDRLGVKQDIQTAKRKYFNPNKGMYWALVIGVIFVSAAVYYFNSPTSKYSPRQSSTIALVKDTVAKELIVPPSVADTTAQEIQQSNKGSKISNKVSKNSNNVSEIRSKESENESFQLPSKAYQYFKINQHRDTTLVGLEGTIIEIKSNSFNINSNELTIRLKEYYKMSDMAFSNLTTMTIDNEIIETGGMIYIDAISKEGEKIELHNEKEFKLKFPYTEKKHDMQLFIGETNQEKNVQWNLIQKNEINEEPLQLTEREFISLAEPLAIRKPFNIVENMPVFPGCPEMGSRKETQNCTDIKTQNYIKSNLKYPSDAMEAGVSGTVYIKYTIDQKGFVSNVNLIKGIHPSIDNEAIRIVKSLPRFEPGSQRGKNVPVQFTLPIKFNYSGASDFKSYSKEEMNAYNDSVMEIRRTEKLKTMEDNIESIEETIANNSRKEAEKVAADVEYYIFSSSNLGWINCDRFIRGRRERVNYSLADIPKNSRVRIIFKDLKGIVGGNWRNDTYSFSNLPIGEEVIIFVVKRKKDQTFICFQEAKISKKSPELKFKKATVEDIKSYSKKMNDIHS